MNAPVKAFWFQIHYGKRSEVHIYTGTDLQSVLDRISAAQARRLKYNPSGPRITRIAALAPLPHDKKFGEWLDECLRIESNAFRDSVRASRA